MAMKTPEKQILPIAPAYSDLDRLTKWAGDMTRTLQDNLARIARKANDPTLDQDLNANGFSITNLKNLTMTGTFQILGGTAQIVVGGTDGSSANALPAILLRKRASGFSETIGATNGSNVETGRFGYNDTSSYWYMRANGIVNDAIQFNTNGIPLFGGQIAFPATQNASAGANTLDDYEEQTWTAGFDFNGGTTGLTYGTRVAKYVKIGQAVLATFDVALTAKGTSTGVFRLTGLPFTSLNDALIGTINIAFYSGMTGLTGDMLGYVNLNSTTGQFGQSSATGFVNLTDTAVTNTSRVVGTAIYRAA